jgi:hypothetical protein
MLTPVHLSGLGATGVDPMLDWITPPSLTNPMKCFELYNSCDYLLHRNVQPANPGFVPDSNFYDAINLDGLWVLATQKCIPGTAARAAQLLQSYVPLEIRKMFLQWRAPKAFPVGPFRILILSEDEDQRAGDCPDLPDDWGSDDEMPNRSNTTNPVCITSDSDIWNTGQTLIHEFTHACDMVLAQQLDPSLLQEKQRLYDNAIAAGTYGSSYAATSMHEYHAELLTMWMNVGQESLFSEPLRFNNQSDLKREDPEAFEFIKKFFKAPPDDTSLPMVPLYAPRIKGQPMITASTACEDNGPIGDMQSQTEDSFANFDGPDVDPPWWVVFDFGPNHQLRSFVMKPFNPDESPHKFSIEYADSADGPYTTSDDFVVDTEWSEERTFEVNGSHQSCAQFWKVVFQSTHNGDPPTINWISF